MRMGGRKIALRRAGWQHPYLQQEHKPDFQPVVWEAPSLRGVASVTMTDGSDSFDMVAGLMILLWDRVVVASDWTTSTFESVILIDRSVANNYDTRTTLYYCIDTIQFWFFLLPCCCSLGRQMLSMRTEMNLSERKDLDCVLAGTRTPSTTRTNISVVILMSKDLKSFF